MRLCRDNERGASRLREGPKKVRSHARDIADIVPNIVRDCRWVPGIILWYTSDNLPGKIGANIRGFRVDASANPAEHCDRGAAEAKAGDALEKFDCLRRNIEHSDIHAYEEI